MCMSNTPTLLVAVQTLRSYNQALAGMNNDQSAIENWIRRYAEADSRSSTFPKDAAIGLLSYLGNTVFAANNITANQQAWSAEMASAEQIMQQENNWIGRQSVQHNATTFARLFGSDIKWIQLYAQSKSITPNSGWTDEYLVNMVIADLRLCNGSGGAGAIPHTAMNPSSNNQLP